MNEDQTERIRSLNDRFRKTGFSGQILITQGIQALGESQVGEVMRAVMEFDDFTEGNDPHGEHDFGSFESAGQTVFWKIDYYNCDLDGGSPDPADEAVTRRVLTVMLASEY
ncbi:MAG: DUF3768 domain-containing protein [Novosphingobium sp.]|nr:DUF3768 domain-containing protein [Novosphingobium sp.]